jgi:2-polyprenyl-6-methoxyphenol hydroxylase-like FAD-dependent oxidoreductase
VIRVRRACRSNEIVRRFMPAPLAIDDAGSRPIRCRPRQRRCRSALQAFLPIDGDFDICGFNLDPVHQSGAKPFRRGRVILVGDAAHVNSPIGGMGLNSGVHDAFELAAKLPESCEGRPTMPSLTGTTDNGVRSQPITRRLLEERYPAVRRRKAAGGRAANRRYGHQLVDYQRLGRQRLLAREGKQPLGQGRGALRTVHGGLDEAIDVGLAARELR